MESAERLAAFKRIRDHFDALDREGLRHGRLPMHSTDFGFWGTTNMNDAYAFFAPRIRLERFRHFADLGCGDGRIVLIASLFTDATGVEGDKLLVELGEDAIAALALGKASGHVCELKYGNYYNEDFSSYDALFMFPDNRYDAIMTGKLLKEFKGYLFIYNKVHLPHGLKAGKTYWIDQMPIGSYAVNVDEKNLELE